MGQPFRLMCCLWFATCSASSWSGFEILQKQLPPFTVTHVQLPQRIHNPALSPTGQFITALKEHWNLSPDQMSAAMSVVLLEPDGKMVADLTADRFDIQGRGFYWGLTDNEIYFSAVAGRVEDREYHSWDKEQLLLFRLDLKTRKVQLVDQRWWPYPHLKEYLTSKIIYSQRSPKGYYYQLELVRRGGKSQPVGRGYWLRYSPNFRWGLYRKDSDKKPLDWLEDGFVVCTPQGKPIAQFLDWQDVLLDREKTALREVPWVRLDSPGNDVAWLYDGRILVGGWHEEISILEGTWSSDKKQYVGKGIRQKMPHLWLIDWQKGQRKIINLPIELISGSLDGKHLLVKVEDQYYRLDFTPPEK